MARYPFFLIVVLSAVTCLLVFSCDSLKEDPEWSPTVALPLVKESQIQVYDLLDQHQANFASRIGLLTIGFWDAFVYSNGASTINQIAYEALLKTSYVTVGQQPPVLSSKAIQLFSSEVVSRTAFFLTNYYALSHNPSHSTTVSLDGDQVVRAILEQVCAKNDPSVLELSGALIGLMDVLRKEKGQSPSYMEVVNVEIREHIEFNMEHVYALNISALNSGQSPVEFLTIYLGLHSQMAIGIILHADLVDDSGSWSYPLFGGTGQVLSPPSSRQWNSVDREVKVTDKKEMSNILGKASKLRVRLDKGVIGDMTSEDLRTFSSDYVGFSARLLTKSQGAGMVLLP